MEFAGRIQSINKDFATGKGTITFEVNDLNLVLAEYERLRKVEKLRVKADKYREKRSLNANAYMWVLCQKIAEVIHTDKDSVYLQMLDKYGKCIHVVVRPEAVERFKALYRVVRVLGDVTVNRQKGTQLQCYIGSSQYDTKEMSILIDGIVSECQDLDIETLPPAEIEKMKAMWGVEE